MIGTINLEVGDCNVAALNPLRWRAAVELARTSIDRWSFGVRRYAIPLTPLGHQHPVCVLE